MSLRIIFMGTPEFAIPSLKKLIESSHQVVGVVTSVDKRGGRGRSHIIKSDVKKYVERFDIPLLQTHDFEEKEFLKSLKALKADLQVVVAFKLLPKIVWNMPPLGSINLHASLLPDYRGAAPIQWAIINGEKETGVTTFQLKQKVDTGDILLQKSVPIKFTDNASDLHDRLMLVGATLILKTINGIEDGSLTAQTQPTKMQKKAPKLTKRNRRIDFSKSSVEVYNIIRGLSPYPTAWTYLNGSVLKIYRAAINASIEIEPLPGNAFVRDFNFNVACKDGWLRIEELQIEGKKKMSAKDFLNGYSDPIEKLGS